jgi:hypothetical protein
MPAPWTPTGQPTSGPPTMGPASERPVRAAGPTCAASPVNTLAHRAIGAYRALPAVSSTDPGWTRRAARALRLLASILGVDPGQITAVPDPDRRYGLLATPEVLLTVTDSNPPTGPDHKPDHDAGNGVQPLAGGYRFVPEYGTTDVFVLMVPCPDCGRDVPTHRVATLADLGRHLTLDGLPDGGRSGERSGRSRAGIEPDAAQFASDPAHAPACPRHRADPRYASAHRP